MTTAESPLSRRRWLGSVAAGAFAGGSIARAAAPTPQSTLSWIQANRPSRRSRLPADFRARFGATHVNGHYCLTDKPYLIEGAEKLLSLGTRLGKFWIYPDEIKADYFYHHTWGKYARLVDLARAPEYAPLLAMPFSTFVFECLAPAETGWNSPEAGAAFYAAVTREYYDLTAYLYQVMRTRPVLIVLQNWEGDWMLRGPGERWTPPPADWPARCARLCRLFAARQGGVEAARRAFGQGAKCTVANALEVNRVLDNWNGIPTVTHAILPYLTVDLVSYSAWECTAPGASPLLLWNCIDEIRRHARTGPLFGPGAVAIGEYGIAENDEPSGVTERYDVLLGVMLAAGVKYAAQWELYCNTLRRNAPQFPASVRDPRQLAGLWLVRPDGSLSAAGRYFRGLWQRAGAA